MLGIREPEVYEKLQNPYRDRKEEASQGFSDCVLSIKPVDVTENAKQLWRHIINPAAYTQNLKRQLCLRLTR